VVTSDEVHDLSSFVRTLADTLGLGAEIQDSWHLPPASLPSEGTGRHIPVNVAAQLLLLVLMWLIVMTVPVAIQESKLTAETQQTLNDYYVLLGGLAVSITFLIAPKLMNKTARSKFPPSAGAPVVSQDSEDPEDYEDYDHCPGGEEKQAPDEGAPAEIR
jgi:hypothetical protein